jgi:hypothetical protein
MEAVEALNNQLELLHLAYGAPNGHILFMEEQGNKVSGSIKRG